MAMVYLGLGSNVRDRFRFLQGAVEEIKKLPETSIKRSSSIYETEPLGYKEQADFLNVVLEIETELVPSLLFERLKEVEKKVGRTSTVRWGPREIDIDILFYNAVLFRNEKLVIPHPELVNRKFVLVPLADLNSQFQHPELRKTVKELLKSCTDTGRVEKTSLSLTL